jgi:hypothetical protein
MEVEEIAVMVTVPADAAPMVGEVEELYFTSFPDVSV